ncbi:hypothetical protein KUTeg_015967 [Tegillarca granosa]|uniref:Carboxylesterase type B domain-containing protein n=1 Tax=Tegillarca granosa TaxID=220873 RepID=A0ABQ9EJH1_TEGGR|nr:hypothetical protein KUTeg_015967 [Tegillarca granosa]
MFMYKYSTILCRVFCFVGVMLLGCHGDKMEFVIRSTAYGKIKGFISERVKGNPVENYLGVPYAAPPVGDLRFEYPQKPAIWSGTRDTLTLPAACPQRGDFSYIQMHKNFTIESEDCLYLNNKTQNKFPILLYIHGGSNEVGMGAMLDGDVLAGFGKIIVITFNYRLGALGFIGAREEGLKGNYGFLDQVAAMKWVRNNIHNFNGDPSMVTIDGHSAGAADVGFHVISPMSKGLFRYAVVQSGSPLAFWAMSRPEWRPGYNIDDCKKERASCSVDLNIPYKQYLKSLSKDVIKNIPGKPTPANLIAFPAIVDGEFLTDWPEKILNTGVINGESYFLSFTRDEGSQHAAITMSRKNFGGSITSISINYFDNI